MLSHGSRDEQRRLTSVDADDTYSPTLQPASSSSSSAPPFIEQGPRPPPSSAPAQLASPLSSLKVSDSMSKRTRADSLPHGPRIPRSGYIATSSSSSSNDLPIPPLVDSDDDDTEESASRRRQKIIARISAQTSVDPSDQLRSDQLATVPRSYQLELAELAKAGNVLVCLDTGSGKTLISVLLLQYVHQHSSPPPTPSLAPSSGAQPFSSPAPQRKVAFFLVNLVPLVHQQSSVIAGNSRLSVGKLYGELKDSLRSKSSQLAVDDWRSPQWSALLASHQVIVSTAQCFLDALIHGFIKMSDLNLLIFDEVHHALKNHPFFRIMKYYRLAKEEERPKIFGMTASPIFTGSGRFDEASQYLQRAMDARIHTVSRGALRELEEVKRRPEEMVVEFEPYLTVVDEPWNADAVKYSELSMEMIELFSKKVDLEICLDDEEEEVDPLTEAFEKEVRPKLEYTMRHLGPIGCDFFWHSTLLEYRSRARKWANIDRNQRTLVSDEWIVEAASTHRSSSVAPSDSQGPPNSQTTTTTITTTTQPGFGLGLTVAHLSTNSDLNSRILLHMRSQPCIPDTLGLNATNSSPKLLRLIELLHCFEPSKSSFCGIIFVERRQTATLLVELVKRIPGLEFIHPEFLLGHDNGAANGGAPGMDWHDQVQVLNRFRRRKPTNLLIATSIAEEGLDIQAANLVIRFDLFNRHISFLQSRGRARAKESRFILMAEKGNQEHAGTILNAFKTEANRAKWLDGIAEPHLAMPDWGEDWQQKLRIDTDSQEGVGVEGGEEEKCMFEPTTGARLFPEDAPTLVSHYAASLHSEYLKDAVLAYRIEKVDGLPSYKAVLELPSTAAVRSVESDGCRSKKAAKRMAAFRACQQLRALGELDEWLMPKLVPRLKKAKDGVVGLVNAHHQAWRGSGKPINVPSKKLDGWARFASSHHHAMGQGWCATLLQLDKFDEGYEPLLLLTRGPLPETKLLKLLHAGSGQMKDLHPKPLRIAPELDSELIGKVVEFTKFVFKLISRKDGHSPKGKRLSWQTIEKGQPTVLVLPVRIAAEEVQSVGDVALDFPPSLDLTQLDLNAEGSEQKLKGRTLVKQHGYHSHSLYQFESIRSDLCPNSPLSSGAAGETYLTQHMKMYARHQASADEHEVEVLAAQLANQPLLSVRKLPKISNLLSPPPSISFSATPATTQGARLIVPYFYALHPLPSTLLRSILLLPSIFTRYDQLLLAQACNNDLLEGRLDNDKVLEALTSPSAGSAFDYERLEFLGDTFLKLIATCHTFTTHLGRTEAELHMANKGIVTNVRLLKEAKRLGLEKYAILPSCNLLPRRFTAPVICNVGGALTNDPSMDHDGQVDVVKEKTLSDIVESLIGAALLSPSSSSPSSSSPSSSSPSSSSPSSSSPFSSSPSSPSSTSTALFVCRILHLIPSTISRLCDFNKLLEEIKHESVERNWSSRLNPPSLRHLQSLFSHTYRYPHLALESFTHPSLLASILPSYQRLEFLGDAWIDFFIVSRIYTEGGGLVVLDPGEMTALKGVLASNAALSALGVKLGLHKFIASNSAVLVESIAKYGKGLEKVLRKGGGEGQYWTKAGMVQVPKAVADVVEASFASIVVDSGFDQDTAQRVFGRIFTPFYDEHCKWEDLRVGEVKRVIEYLSSCFKRRGGGGGVMLEVSTNLVDLPAIASDVGDKDGEEAIMCALLTPVNVEFKVRGTTIAKIKGVLAKTPLHLTRAVGIARELHELEPQMAKLSKLRPLSMDDSPVLALNSSDDEEEEEEMQTDQSSNLEQPDEEMPQANTAISNHQDDQAAPTEASKPQTNENWEDLIDHQEHLLLQLARTLGWKSTIQTPLTSPATAEEKEEVVMTLAKIRDLILPPPSSSDSDSDSAK
ncbi:hypothetical protein NDA17_003666 [Ustilago hordei]|nr:hypothetical protein NDA17_003666 [Ustilago hordei]